MKNLVIYGIGDFARLTRHYFDNNGEYKVVAFCADRDFVKDDMFAGLPVYPLDTLAAKYAHSDIEIFVAVGYKSMLARELMFKKAEALGYLFASMRSPQAGIDETAKLGRNLVIFPGVQIEPHVQIGDNCVIWSSSVICHDSIISGHCFIAAQSLIGGRAKLGARCFLGFNTTIMQDIRIGDDCLVGAKSLVTQNIPSSSKCYGIPARVVGELGSEGVFVK